jgi:Na+/proline symporter
MKLKAGLALSLIALAMMPLAASAQQAPVYFAVEHVTTPRPVLQLAQDPPSDKPEDVMSTSGMFLGIIGMLGGAVAGKALAQNACEDAEDTDACSGRYAFTGALVAGTALVPIGVHIANKNPGSLLKSLAVSAVTGAGLYYGMKAIPGEPVQIAPFLSAPLQMFTSVKIERGGKSKQ